MVRCAPTYLDHTRLGTARTGCQRSCLVGDGNDREGGMLCWGLYWGWQRWFAARQRWCNWAPAAAADGAPHGGRCTAGIRRRGLGRGIRLCQASFFVHVGLVKHLLQGRFEVEACTGKLESTNPLNALKRTRVTGCTTIKYFFNRARVTCLIDSLKSL